MFGRIIALYAILGSPFYCRHNAHFSFELIGFDIFFGILGIFSLHFVSKK
jgi:hypothetical protein